MPFHAHWQRLDALQYLPCSRCRHAGTEVAQAFAAAAQQEGRRGRFLGEHHVVKAVIRCGKRREVFTRQFTEPVKPAAIHQQPADHHAVPLQKFGCGMKHDVGAVLERADQIRRGQRGVEHQRYASPFGAVRGVCNLCDLLNVDQQIAGVAQRFTEKQARVWAHGRTPRVEIARIHECRFNAEPRQRVVEQIV